MDKTMTVSAELFSQIVGIAKAYGHYPAMAYEEAAKRGGKRLTVESVAYDEKNETDCGEYDLTTMQAMRWRMHITSRSGVVTLKDYEDVMWMIFGVVANGEDGQRRTLTIDFDGTKNVTLALSQSPSQSPAYDA